MSSQVNKSSTRFIPKMARRGPGQAPPRRLSTLRASFSAPLRPVLSTPQPSQTTEDSATQKDAPKKGEAQTQNAELPLTPQPTQSGSSSTANEGAMKPPPQPAQVTDSANAESAIDDSAIAEDELPAPSALSLEKPSRRRPSTADTIPQTALHSSTGINTEQIAPIGRKRRRESNAVPMTMPVSARAVSAPSAAPSIEATPAPGAPENRPQSDDILIRKARRKDADGRELIEPEDLPGLSRGSRGQLTAEDKDAISNRIIDVERFTMAALCTDIPVGQMNDNFDNYETARISRKRRRARILKAKQMLRGKYEPKREEEREELLELYREYREEREEQFGKVREESQANMQALDNEMGNESGAGPAIQLQRNQQGEIMVESQTVDRHRDNPSARDDLQRKEERPWDRVINSYSFSTKERPERWTPEETERFYHALSAWGTDFNLIAHMFPTRSRHQIKTKYKYEEKRHPEKVQLYLVHRRRIKLEDYAIVSGKQIVEVSDMERDLAQIRMEHAEQVKLEETLKQQALEEDAKNQNQSQNQSAAQKDAKPASKSTGPRRGVKRERALHS